MSKHLLIFHALKKVNRPFTQGVRTILYFPVEKTDFHNCWTVHQTERAFVPLIMYTYKLNGYFYTYMYIYPN